jgi:hypothetical protein
MFVRSGATSAAPHSPGSAHQRTDSDDRAEPERDRVTVPTTASAVSHVRAATVGEILDRLANVTLGSMADDAGPDTRHDASEEKHARRPTPRVGPEAQRQEKSQQTSREGDDRPHDRSFPRSRRICAHRDAPSRCGCSRSTESVMTERLGGAIAGAAKTELNSPCWPADSRSVRLPALDCCWTSVLTSRSSALPSFAIIRVGR